MRAPATRGRGPLRSLDSPAKPSSSIGNLPPRNQSPSTEASRHFNPKHPGERDIPGNELLGAGTILRKRNQSVARISPVTRERERERDILPVPSLQSFVRFNDADCERLSLSLRKREVQLAKLLCGKWKRSNLQKAARGSFRACQKFYFKMRINDLSRGRRRGDREVLISREVNLPGDLVKLEKRNSRD